MAEFFFLCIGNGNLLPVFADFVETRNVCIFNDWQINKMFKCISNFFYDTIVSITDPKKYKYLQEALSSSNS